MSRIENYARHNRPIQLLLRSMLASGLLVAPVFSSFGLAEGFLQEVDNEIGRLPATGDKKNSQRHDDDHHHHHDCDDDDGYDVEFSSSSDSLLGNLFVVGLTSPFWLPNAVVESGEHVPSGFADYPYDGVAGFMAHDRGSRAARSWAGRLQVDYGNDFGDLQRGNARLLMEHETRLGIDAQTDFWHEELVHSTDQAWTGDANLTYRFAQNRKWQWRTGAGINWYNGEEANDVGFNFTYGVDYFPMEPVVVTSVLDWGTFGSASLFRFETTAGFVLDRFEAFVGFNHLFIGSTESNMLIGGLRVWF